MLKGNTELLHHADFPNPRLLYGTRCSTRLPVFKEGCQVYFLISVIKAVVGMMILSIGAGQLKTASQNVIEIFTMRLGLTGGKYGYVDRGLRLY